MVQRIEIAARDAAERPPIESFLGLQRRFHHLVRRDPADGSFVARPGAETELERMREWTQSNVERLYALADLK